MAIVLQNVKIDKVPKITLMAFQGKVADFVNMLPSLLHPTEPQLKYSKGNK